MRRISHLMSSLLAAASFSVVAAPPSLDELRSFAGAQLAHHKLPEGVCVVDALPLTPMEKVDRRALRALVEDAT